MANKNKTLFSLAEEGEEHKQNNFASHLAQLTCNLWYILDSEGIEDFSEKCEQSVLMKSLLEQNLKADLVRNE